MVSGMANSSNSFERFRRCLTASLLDLEIRVDRESPMSKRACDCGVNPAELQRAAERAVALVTVRMCADHANRKSQSVSIAIFSLGEASNEPTPGRDV